MEATISISKACFAFKRKRNKQSPRKRISKPYDYFNADNENTARQRYTLFKDAWKAVEDAVEAIQLEFHSDLVKGVIDIVQQHQYHSVLAPSSSLRSEIPTVALVTGVNVSDHKAIFSSLITNLKESNFDYIANIEHKDGISLKQLIQNLVSNFMGCMSECESDEQEISFKSKLKPSNLTLPVLAAWYEDECSNKCASTPKKSCKRQTPLIIIIENVEGVNPSVLQDFVTICSGYVTRLPLVFIFGIPTTASSIHRLLPQSVSRFLSLETLQAPLPPLCLNHIIEKVIMNYNFPFKLGSKTYRLLEEIFLYHDFSVHNFMRGMKFCMMEHYYDNKFSILCCPVQELTLRINKMTSSQLEWFRQLPSFMMYVESCPAQTQRELLIDDDAFQKFLLAHLGKFTEYHLHFYAVLHLLHSFVSGLPSYPLGRLVREVYGSSLEMPIAKSQEYEEAIKFIRVCARDELLSKIKSCKNTLHDHKSEELISVSARLKSYIDRLERLELIQEPDRESTNPTKNTENIKASGRTEFLENLRQSAKKLKRPNAYEVLREEIIEFLNGVFRKFLSPPATLPLCEVFYFDNVSAVKTHLMAAPRSSIHLALSDPANYLECNCCEIEDSGSILPTMPDICIAYKLHLECGRLINLYDWLQAFIIIAKSGNNAEENDEKTLHARFVRAVSELQLLGFITPTRKKTDHVARLTWGGC